MLKAKYVKLSSLICFLMSVFFYAWYLKTQYNEFFFEAQFLHIPFLNDVLNHQFHFVNFLTVYGEHLFPGYNLFLWLNLKLFKVSAFFDLLICFFTAICTSLVLAKVAKENRYFYIVGPVIFFLMMNPVLNPMYGMALAAQFSILILVTITYLIFINYSNIRLFFIIPFIFFYVIFFAGAYAIGFLAILAIMMLMANAYEDKTKCIWILAASFMIYAMYYLIITYVAHNSLVQMAHGYQIDPKRMLQFLNLMFGSSFLGKAFFESYQSLLFYNVMGVFVFINLGFIAWSIRSQFKTLEPADKYFLALLSYSLLNVFVVTVARNTNGLEGALGQWYQVHLRFIPIAIIYFYFRFLPKSSLCNSVFLFIFFLGTFYGYSYEFKKAKYVPGWRHSYNKNIANYLSARNGLEEKPTHQIMLWDDRLADEGVFLLYNHGLNYFKNDDYLNLSAITDDKWIEKTPYQFIDIFCPVSSDLILIKFDLMNEPALKALAQKYNVKLGKASAILEYKFNKPIKQLHLDLDTLPEMEHDKNLDKRSLIFHVDKVRCI